MEGIIYSDTLLNIAAKTYKMFRQSTDWDEKYKYTILAELNKSLNEKNVDSSNVLSIIELLQQKNPSEGSFVHWSELDNLKKTAMNNPTLTSDFINTLLNQEKNISERINEARSIIKKDNKGSYGAPLIGYILAAFNMNAYTVFKDEIFRDFYNIIDRKFNYGNDIGKKYDTYLKICQILQQYLYDNDILEEPTLLDGQDFMYTVTRYNRFKKLLIKKIFYKGYNEWFIKDPHSKKPEYIYEQVKKEKIQKLSKNEFIEFFYNFVRNGGDIQSGGYRNASKFKEFIQQNYNQFHEYIMEIYKEDFNVKRWINQKDQIKYAGKGILTIFLHEVYPDKYAVWNNKTEDALNKVGLLPKKQKEDTTGDYYLKIVETEQRLKELLPEKQNLYTVDAMMHYIIAELPKQKIDTSDYSKQYWKIAPGKDAWNWENCKENGFIAIGWDEFGDLSNLSRDEFEEKRNNILKEYTNWTEVGVEQLWKFAKEIKPGDIIIANKGTTKILGIGKVTGDYYFTPTTRHGHRIPVDWFDTKHKTVAEYGWRRTLIPLDKEKIDSLLVLSLAFPFNQIFEDTNFAHNVFDFLQETFKKLEVHDQNDDLISVTITNNNKMLRVNYGNWALTSFTRNTFEVILHNEIIKSLKIENQYEPFSSTEYSIVELSLDEYWPLNQELQNNFDNTLEYVKDRFSEWSQSNYAKHHQPRIAEAILHPEKRENLFKKGLADQTDVDEIHYYWITANPSIWSVDEIKDGGTIFYTAYNIKGNKRRLFEAFQQAKPNDKVIFYESTPVKKIVATGIITEELHTEFDEEFIDEVEGISIQYENPVKAITWEMILNTKSLEQASPVKNRAQGSLFPLTKEEYEIILSLEEFTSEQQKESKKRYEKYNESLRINFSKTIEPSTLYFEDQQDLFLQISSALFQGKHIILCGPPGTGKSKLAKHIVNTYTNDYDITMTTATSSWSTFDTIGGYMPDETTTNTLRFNKGLFLECFQDENYIPQNKWLIIDEINRADIDKAFGSLFSALTGDTITLANKIEGNHIQIIGKPRDIDTIPPHRFFIHTDWRIIATMNTFDKASLYEMSYAFMRRFAFINVNIPTNLDTAVPELLNRWGITLNLEFHDKIRNLWRVINKFRILGPAIIEDIAKHLQQSQNIASAISMYVFPQFEGLMNDDIVKIIKSLRAEEVIDKKGFEYLKRTSSDFFDIKQGKFNHDKNNP